MEETVFSGSLAEAATWFQGRTALVTGASSGIGYQIATALGLAGTHVGVNYCKNRAGAEAAVAEITAGGGQAIAIQADVSSTQEVERMFGELEASFGERIDMLVNNSGQWMPRQPIVECSDETFDQMWAVNGRSVFLCCRTAARKMIAQKEGIIVNMGSVVGHSGGGGGTVPYAAAKAAVNTLTRGLARELGPHGIRVNGVCPGVIETPMTSGIQPEAREAVVNMTPLRRIGEAHEIARGVLALLSPACSFVSGTIVDMDGGYLTR